LTHEEFDSDNDKFTYAVFSDLTGGERPKIFEIAVAQLNLLLPELIINVGDLIDGGTADLDDLDAQWDSFDERAKQAKTPVFYAGGNHDLTGQVLQQVWDERYGRRYYHFVYKNVLFLVLDTEDNTPERAREVFEIRKRALERIKKEGMEVFDETEYATLPEQTREILHPSNQRTFAALSLKTRMCAGRFSSCTRHPGSARTKTASRP